MQEGLAYICLITPNLTITRAKIDVNIPKKRKGNVNQHEKVSTNLALSILNDKEFSICEILVMCVFHFSQGLLKFYELLMQGLLRHVNFDLVKVILIASPGFVRDQFFEYLYQEAVKNDIKLLFENKSKFLLVHSSSGFKHSLKGNFLNPYLFQNSALLESFLLILSLFLCRSTRFSCCDGKNVRYKSSE